MKTVKQRARFIKLMPVIGIMEYFIHIGGFWYYAGNTRYRTYKIPNMSYYIERDNTFLRYTEQRLEKDIGRKINFKRESFIHEWESESISLREFIGE